ncbi:outer membrane lipoprotein carrier protein LolA [Flavobacteriales bacterium]|nr:outer membrane lipoprotein carrier protein LolA [Flavobacteriales bacterium]
MRKNTLFIINITFTLLLAQSQNINPSKILDNVFEKFNNKNGVDIEFEYTYTSPSYNLDQSANGHIALFDNNKFYLEFNSPSKIIQINNNETFTTIMIKEKEILIDSINDETFFFLKDVFNNYKSQFTSKIIEENNEKVLIQLTPIKTYNTLIYNHCIDILKLQPCLKLPIQCKIGLTKENKLALNNCITENKGYKKLDIDNILIDIDHSKYLINSMTQKNTNQGIGKISIKQISIADTKCLQIDTNKYPGFDIIDLR